MTTQHIVVLQPVSWVGGSFASWCQLWCWGDCSQQAAVCRGWNGCDVDSWESSGFLIGHSARVFGVFFFFFLAPSRGLQGLPHCLVAGFWERASGERGEVARLVSLGVKEKMHILIGTELFRMSSETDCHSVSLLSPLWNKFLVSFFSWVVLYFGVCGVGVVALILSLG